MSVEKLEDYLDRSITTRAAKKAVKTLKPFDVALIKWKSERLFADEHGMIVQTVRSLAESGAMIDESGKVFTAKYQMFRFKIRGYESCKSKDCQTSDSK